MLLAEFVQGEEFPGQCDVLQEAAGGQLDPDDDLPVRHHHGHIPELNLQILGQFLTALQVREKKSAGIIESRSR